MDTSIETVKIHPGICLSDGSNQNILRLICFWDSLPNQSFHSTPTPEDFHHQTNQPFLTNINHISSVSQQSALKWWFKWWFKWFLWHQSRRLYHIIASLRFLWDSSEARSLFQQQPKETVEGCLQRQIKILKAAYKDWSKLMDRMEA